MWQRHHVRILFQRFWNDMTLHPQWAANELTTFKMTKKWVTTGTRGSEEWETPGYLRVHLWFYQELQINCRNLPIVYRTSLWMAWECSYFLFHLQFAKPQWSWLDESMNLTSGWFERFFIFYPYLGKWSILTDIFQLGWNHQLVHDGILNGVGSLIFLT